MRYIYLAGTEVLHSPSMHAPQFRRGPRAPVTVSKKGPSVNTSTEYSLAQTARAINFASEVAGRVSLRSTHRADPWHLA